MMGTPDRSNDKDIVLFNAADGNAWRPILLAHLLSLGPVARRARFHATCHDHNIEAYVARAKPSFVLVLMDGTAVAACAEIHVTDRTAPGGAVAEAAISVVDAQQGRRLGSRLMAAMERVSARAGIATITLHFDASNLPMQRLAMHRKRLRDYLPTLSATGAQLNALPA
jgi:GNAT superfamily N-acetyltransferase